MATENIDQDLLDNGIKEPANADIEPSKAGIQQR